MYLYHMWISDNKEYISILAVNRVCIPNFYMYVQLKVHLPAVAALGIDNLTIFKSVLH